MGAAAAGAYSCGVLPAVGSLGRAGACLTYSLPPLLMKNDQVMAALYDTHAQAERAVKELQASGYNLKSLSVVGQEYHTEEKVVGYYNLGDRMLS